MDKKETAKKRAIEKGRLNAKTKHRSNKSKRVQAVKTYTTERHPEVDSQGPAE
jgi:hypothetical protein